MNENLPDLLTRKEAQKVLCIGKNTILNLIHTKKLPVLSQAAGLKSEKTISLNSLITPYIGTIIEEIELFRTFAFNFHAHNEKGLSEKPRKIP